MITMEMIGKVRRMKLREQLSNSEIAKRTGLSRNTVKKWLKAPGDQAPKYKRQSGFTKLSAFEATLVQALKADSHRPKHARRSARALLAQLQAQTTPLSAALSVAQAQVTPIAPVSLNEAQFRFALNEDAMATEKLAEGIRAFCVDAVKLEALMH